MNEVYETKISDARWILYDIPGNVGWILYLICLIMLFRGGMYLFAAISTVPMVLMLIGIFELISERIARLDRVLPQIRLYRGFGALMIGGALGIVASATGLKAFGGTVLITMLLGAILCTVFAALLFFGYKRKDQHG